MRAREYEPILIVALGIAQLALVELWGSKHFGLDSMLDLGAKMHEPIWFTIFVWTMLSGVLWIMIGLMFALSHRNT